MLAGAQGKKGRGLGYPPLLLPEVRTPALVPRTVFNYGIRGALPVFAWRGTPESPHGNEFDPVITIAIPRPVRSLLPLAILHALPEPVTAPHHYTGAVCVKANGRTQRHHVRFSAVATQRQHTTQCATLLLCIPDNSRTYGSQVPFGLQLQQRWRLGTSTSMAESSGNDPCTAVSARRRDGSQDEAHTMWFIYLNIWQ